MSPTHPLWALAAFLVALGTAWIPSRHVEMQPSMHRYASLDGLRGILALAVFLHHATVWYFYLHSGNWAVPPSAFFAQLGQSGVALFFMITAFLFTSKLLDGRRSGVDWRHLYRSRLLRLVPLYGFAVTLLFVIVAVLTQGRANVPVSEILISALRWLGFTIAGATDINAVQYTRIIVAGVTWSLADEWLFYAALPLLACLLGVRTRVPVWLASAMAVAGMLVLMWPGLEWLPMSPFLGGFAAALLVRSNPVGKLATTRLATLIAYACLGTVLFRSDSAPLRLALLTLAFTAIAGGNSLFGILTLPAARMLGRASYSIYLLHGIALFVTFVFVLGIARSRSLTPSGYWLLIIGAVTPILVIFSTLTYRWIELPAIRAARVTASGDGSALDHSAPP